MRLMHLTITWRSYGLEKASARCWNYLKKIQQIARFRQGWLMNLLQVLQVFSEGESFHLSSLDWILEPSGYFGKPWSRGAELENSNLSCSEIPQKPVKPLLMSLLKSSEGLGRFCLSHIITSPYFTSNGIKKRMLCLYAHILLCNS